MLSADEKRVLAPTTVSVAEYQAMKARHAGVRGSGKFPGGEGDESGEGAGRGDAAYRFLKLDDGREGGRRVAFAPTGAGVPDGEKPAHLDDDRDGERDYLADAQWHQLAGREHDDDEAVEAGVCEGENCKIDHLAEAHRLLGEHLRGRGDMAASRLRFER
jgi:hypothetical protein